MTHICASGGNARIAIYMPKCENCHKHTTSSNSGQWLFTVAPDEVARCMSTRSNRWICNTCTIPPPNYPPPALVNLPDDQKEEDIVEEKDPPPPSHPPARTEVKCHKLNAVGWGQLWMPNAETKRIDARTAAEEAAEHVQKNDDKKDDQKEDDTDGNNDDTKIEDLVNLI